MFNDDVQFELVREVIPYCDECNHYHAATMPHQTAETCNSELCCVFGGTRTE